jgi:hypothetical protein
MLAIGYDLPIPREPDIHTKLENILQEADEFRFDKIKGVNLAIEIFTQSKLSISGLDILIFPHSIIYLFIPLIHKYFASEEWS